MRSIIGFRVLLMACWLALAASATAQPLLPSSVSNPYFTVKLPDGFKPLLTQTNEGTAEYYFGRNHTGEQTSAVFYVMVKEQKEENQDPTALSAHLKAYLDGYCLSMQGAFDKYSKKGGADMLLGGMPFRQVEWEGEKMGRQMKGRLYAGIVNGRRYAIRLQDLEPHAEKGIPLMIETVKNLKFPKE